MNNLFSVLFFYILLLTNHLLINKKKDDFKPLQHYNSKDLSIKMKNYNFTEQVSIKLENRTIILYGNDLKKNPECIIALYDKKDTLLDSLSVFYYYGYANSESYYDNNSFCMECLSDTNPIIFIAYCNNERDDILIVPINYKGLFGICSDLHFIYYSLEYENKNIKRFSVDSGELYEYEQSFAGGVNIYKEADSFYFNYQYPNSNTITYKIKNFEFEEQEEFHSELIKKQIQLE